VMVIFLAKEVVSVRFLEFVSSKTLLFFIVQLRVRVRKLWG